MARLEDLTYEMGARPAGCVASYDFVRFSLHIAWSLQFESFDPYKGAGGGDELWEWRGRLLRRVWTPSQERAC